MWNAIANMIIKAADNMNRGVENATKAGEGNNGVDYSNVSTGSEGGSVGGGYQKPEEQDTSGTQAINNAVSNVKEMGKEALSKIENKDDDKGEEKKEAVANTAPVSAPTTSAPTTSDERLKRIFGDNPDAIEAFARLDSIKFTYNDKAKEIHPNEENGVDNDQHYGIKAQDLEKNPYTTAVVSEDPNGYKQIDPAELTSANTAVIAEICKRLLIIEKVLGIKVV